MCIRDRACLVLSRAEKILTTADVISCMSLEGFGGNTSQLRTEAAKKRKYEGQIETAKACLLYTSHYGYHV